MQGQGIIGAITWQVFATQIPMCEWVLSLMLKCAGRNERRRRVAEARRERASMDACTIIGIDHCNINGIVL
ncbi:unnamed protein product [Chondrus crispus]|uniref:Uncharacterized protein n=1 Tax=Chondrus crispus TaxID=2769 RepID=R7QEI1_CHOCR|nr:unnamed protein product [Chondrus crispus]CDF36178.1 unnamed protein product [Chondrus crispus]|eukprot:XP_005715997.1 unnamed protein product [Chondrus crispus]